MRKKDTLLKFNEFDNSKKSICFIASSGMSLRNFLLKSSLKSILKLQDKYNIVFITENNYIETYDQRINFLQIEYIENKLVLKISKFLNIISRLLFDKLNYTNTKKIQYKYDWLGNIYSRTFYIFKRFIPKSNFIFFILRKIDNHLIKLFSPEIKDLMKRINPFHVISLDPINKKEYAYLINSMDLCNTSAVIKSFDNITAKGYIPFVPNNIFVWNNLMVKEAFDAYGYFKPRIYAIGSPQYDHLNSDIELVKPESNQILYCTNSTDIYNDDHKNIAYIISFIEKFNFKLLIRVKQTDSIKRWQKYALLNNVSIYPNIIVDDDANKKCSDKNHQVSLVNQIKESFVVISSYSTIIFDSLALKTPCINLGYTYTHHKNGWDITKCEGFNHIKPLIELDCVDNVRSKEELKSKVLHRYKNNFNNNEEKARKKFLNNFLGANLNNSSLKNLIDKLNLI